MSMKGAGSPFTRLRLVAQRRSWPMAARPASLLAGPSRPARSGRATLGQVVPTATGPEASQSSSATAPMGAYPRAPDTGSESSRPSRRPLRARVARSRSKAVSSPGATPALPGLQVRRRRSEDRRWTAGDHRRSTPPDPPPCTSPSRRASRRQVRRRDCGASRGSAAIPRSTRLPAQLKAFRTWI